MSFHRITVRVGDPKGPVVVANQIEFVSVGGYFRELTYLLPDGGIFKIKDYVLGRCDRGERSKEEPIAEVEGGEKVYYVS